ncbi:MAG: DUF3365 domain-containing protein [Desulfobulbaceae bacterium]|nr:DUF3365 domain-containing protein [Desulfobulbaceae bacterium]
MYKIRNKISFLLLTLFFLGVILSPALAATPKDGKYYFDQLKESILDVLNENQGLINTNPDGSMKTKKLAPKDFYKRIYEQFKKIGVGKTFKMKDMKGETDPAKIAPALTTLLQAGRITTAKAQKDINTEADGSVKLKKFIPAVFGRLVVEHFQKKTGVHMKQTTLGKNGFKERNSYNGPNDWEKAALEKFMSAGWEVNKGYGVLEEGEYRYVKPIYIKKGCLKCHGTPIGEKGPYGHPKEGYETNDIRGGISIALTSK